MVNGVVCACTLSVKIPAQVHVICEMTVVTKTEIFTSLALISILVHACFMLQLQQSQIFSLRQFIHFVPFVLSENILKPICSSLL